MAAQNAQIPVTLVDNSQESIDKSMTFMGGSVLLLAIAPPTKANSSGRNVAAEECR